MSKFEGFTVCYSIPSKTWTVLTTKNCSLKRAKRLWKKFMKKNVNYPIGMYAVGYKNRTIKTFDLATMKIVD